MYHIILDLTDEQVYNLKVRATQERKPIKAVVRDLVVGYLDKRSGDSAAGGGSREKTSAK